jgi:hypothetical protein
VPFSIDGTEGATTGAGQHDLEVLAPPDFFAGAQWPHERDLGAAAPGPDTVRQSMRVLPAHALNRQ